jgi:hypothetical protein
MSKTRKPTEVEVKILLWLKPRVSPLPLDVLKMNLPKELGVDKNELSSILNNMIDAGFIYTSVDDFGPVMLDGTQSVQTGIYIGTMGEMYLAVEEEREKETSGGHISF